MHVRSLLLIVTLLLLPGCGVRDQMTQPQLLVGPPAEGEILADPPPAVVERDPDIQDQISAYIRRIFHDRNGHLWFGTNSDGVVQWDGETLVYHTIDDGFGGHAVRAILEDERGTLWFGTSGGVTSYNGKRFTNYTDADGLPNNDVWSMCLDRDGTLWVGTLDGACRMHPSTQRFTPFALPAATGIDKTRGVTSRTRVRSIIQDQSGRMWFAIGTGGVHIFDGHTLTQISETDGLCGQSVNCILQDTRGHFWFATHHNGICHFDGTTFTNLTATHRLKGLEVWNVYEDSAGNIWFPVEGFGLYRYDGTTFTNFANPQGLTSRAIQCTLEDRKGRFWCGGWLGLFRRDGDSFINVERDGPWR